MGEFYLNYDCVLLRYGELTLKGKNRVEFESLLLKNIREKLSEFTYININKISGRVVIDLNKEHLASEVISSLQEVFGLSGFSPAFKVNHELGQIEQTVVRIMREKLTLGNSSFKVVSRRANKSFPLSSLELNMHLGEVVLNQVSGSKVDVHNPQITLNVEVRADNTYIYTEVIEALGGLSARSSGKALLLISGGIDSPVAGYLSLKRGAELNAVYFHSHPFTSERAKQKVIDLGRILTRYGGRIRLHVVPFTQIQLDIKEKCRPAYLVTIMRRMMLRIAAGLAKKNHALALVTGESLGQVASQTLESMHVINEVTNMPVLRPLVGMDKLEIVNIAKKIGTYETSILPYEDCCTLFLPKAPKTKPNLEAVIHQENLLGQIDKRVAEAVDNTEVIDLQHSKVV